MIYQRECESALGGKDQTSRLNEINFEYSLAGLILKLAPTLWPPHMKGQLTGKHSDAGNDWRQKEKRTAEVKMIR